MTPAQIESLFYAILEEKAIYNELTGISEDKIYNWRKGRGAKPTIGDMLNVLYQLKRIEIILKNEVNEMKKEWEPKSDIKNHPNK